MIDACGHSPTRTHETMLAYARVYDRLCRQAGAESISDSASRLRAVIAWWTTRDGAWSPATIRLYRAAIRASAATLSSSPDWQAADDAGLNCLTSQAPTPRPRTARRRTSARKRKTVSRNDLDRVAKRAKRSGTRTGVLLASMLRFGALIGLRPSEWANARVNEGVLSIRSAKVSNGRGITVREIALDKLGEPFVDKLRQFLDDLEHEIREVGWPRLYRRIAKRLYRICKALKVRPICLYSIRHQALANGKTALDRVDVAALAGHVSVRTAATHYARRRSGWCVSVVLLPTPATRAAVRVTTTTTPIFRSRRTSLGP